MYKVMIDPGHGGKDRLLRSNKGPTGYVEADGVLDISLKLRDILLATGAFEVRLTREKDETIGVRARGKMAADWGADLFISEHSNATGMANNTTVRGTEVYSSVDLKDDALAAEMAKAIAEAIGTKNRGAKKVESKNYPGEDYYGVIDEAQDGGVLHILLIENAYHDNKEDEALLKDDNMRTAIAKAQAKVICRFFGINEKEANELNWKQKIVQEALDLGLITDETWVDKADEAPTIWFVCAIAINLYKKIKGVANEVVTRKLAKKSVNKTENNNAINIRSAIDTDVPGNYYVDCNVGKDTNKGTLKSPFKTINKALSKVVEGDTIIIQAGRYSEIVNITKSHPSKLNIIGIGEVIIDGLNRDVVPGKFVSMASQFTVATDYTYIKNICITNSPCMALRIDGNHCTFENVHVLDSYLGFFIYGSYNKFYDCVSMYNFDYGGIPEWGPDNVGENADGFSINGSYNKFVNCKAAYNADDGFDTYGTQDNIFEYCYAYMNGVNCGNRNRNKDAYKNLTFLGYGNGFKVGPGIDGSPGKKRSANNILNFCVAYNNTWSDFNVNGGTNNRFNNCSAFNNTSNDVTAYRLGVITNIEPGDEVRNFYTNCLAYPHNAKYLDMTGNSVQSHNSWNSGFIIDESDFESLDVNSKYFLRLSSTSKLIGKGDGTNLNKFLGTNPDIGAFQYRLDK